jgi:nucleotide-binding universal stress UspA family protein
MTGTMLAVLDDVDNGAGFIRTILAQAERIDARLVVYLLTPGPLAAPNLAPFGVMYLPDQMLQADSEEQVAKLRATLTDTPVDVEIRGLFDDVAWLAGDVRRARPIGDLAVVGSHETWAIPYLYRRVTEMLALASGGPLLILPPGRSLAPVNHAVLGWKSCPEAVRALHDLVTLLEPGARVDIVSCGDRPAREENPKGHGAIATYLEHSGFEVGSVWLERRYDVAEQLQTHALEIGADLLAAGAFAHSRLRELMFGGVTAGLIGETRIPVLLSR